MRLRKNFLLGIAIFFTSRSLPASTIYTITELPGAQAITNTGLVLDGSGIWTAAAGYQLVDATPYQWETSSSINAGGAIAGSVVSPNGVFPYGQGLAAAAAGQSGQVAILPPLNDGPYTWAAALGINHNGIVVGESGSTQNQQLFQAVRWTNGIVENLAAYLDPAVTASAAIAVNNNGDVVLIANPYNGPAQSFILHGTTLIPITSSDPNVQSVQANAINAVGQIAGSVRYLDGSQQAFIWSNGKMQIAPDFSSYTGPSSAYFQSENDLGLAVGASGPAGVAVGGSGGPAAAVLWDGVNAPINLNDLVDPNSGWYLYAALGINDQGQIVGNGLLNGDPRGFLLTPASIPEPATAALLVAGAVAFLKRRQNSR